MKSDDEGEEEGVGSDRKRKEKRGKSLINFWEAQLT
jgi:hypothetical protein